MNLYEILLGLIPEAVYFSLFMIFTKGLKTKRLLFVLIMVLEYLLLKSMLHYTIYFQIGYTALSFITLKVLYKEKAQVIDVFTFSIASLVLILISMLTFAVLHQYTLFAAIFNRILLLGFVLLFRKQLPKIQNLYKKLWNRNDKRPHKIKSATFRCMNIVAFNVLFYVINLGMLYTFFTGR